MYMTRKTTLKYLGVIGVVLILSLPLSISAMGQGGDKGYSELRDEVTLLREDVAGVSIQALEVIVNKYLLESQALVQQLKSTQGTLIETTNKNAAEVYNQLVVMRTDIANLQIKTAGVATPSPTQLAELTKNVTQLLAEVNALKANLTTLEAAVYGVSGEKRLIASYTENDGYKLDTWVRIGGENNRRGCQTFQPLTSAEISYVSLFLKRAGYPNSLTVTIETVDSKGKPTGTYIARKAYDGEDISTEGTWTRITLENGGKPATNLRYAITAEVAGGINDIVYIGADKSSPSYGAGKMWLADEGKAWLEHSGYDWGFAVYGVME